MLDRIKNWWRHRARGDQETATGRIDAMTAGHADDAVRGGEGGSMPPNYLPTGVDEGRPKK
jgi:hypothetical protein